MGENTNKKILSGIGWAYGERILAQLVSLAVSVVLARMLDPENYGIIEIVIVFINILDAFVSGGFGNALIQKKNADDLDFNTICWFSISLSVVLYGALFFAAPYIAAFYDMPQLTWVTRIMGIRLPVSAFNSVQHAYVQRKMEFKRFFFSTLGGTLVSAIAGILMAYMGFGVWALVAQYMVNAIINTVVLRFTIKWKPRLEWSLARLKSMLRFALHMLGATLTNTVQDNVRSLIIGKVFTPQDLAYYNQGKKYPATLMNNLVGSVQKVMFPAFTDQEACDQIKLTMRKAIRLSSFVLVPVIVGVVAVADTFVLVLLTDKWAPVIPYLRIASLIYLTRTMNSLFQSSLLAIGKSNVNMAHEIVGSVLSLILIGVGAFLLKSVSFIAWSYVFVMIEGTLFFIFFVSKYFRYNIKEIGADFLPYLGIAALMGVAVYFVGMLRINNLLLLVLQILGGIVIYVCLSRIFKIKEFDSTLRLLKHFVGKGKNNH